MVHIANGDALAGTLRESTILGQLIVCREALIDGPVSSDTMEDFWQERARYIQEVFQASHADYFDSVKSEYDRIDSLNTDDDVCLWFEHDLFCQANMWFIVSLLEKRRITNVYRVSPLPRLNTKWEGFGRHTADDLKACLTNRVTLTAGDFKLGNDLWNAYRKSDTGMLLFLGGSLSPCFPRLDEVCKAEADRKRNARPEKVLREIISKGNSEFHEIFRQFSQREAIYGFGDAQVQLMLKDVRRH